MTENVDLETTTSTLSNVSSYLVNFTLVGIIFYLIYKIFVQQNEPETKTTRTPSLPPMKRRDFTLEELKEFDGTRDDGRLLIAVNGKVFDVTKGKMYYGPKGPYSVFAGRDASRGLATFSLESNSLDQYDDLSDLHPSQMESVLEWEMQFKEKYDYVGKLLKPGESHTCYSDDENENVSKSKEE